MILGFADIGDIDAGADKPYEFSAVGESRSANRPHPSILPVRPPKPNLSVERRAVAQRPHVQCQILISVFVVDVTRPVVLRHLVLILHANEFHIRPVDEFTALQAVHPNAHWRAVGDHPKSHFTLA